MDFDHRVPSNEGSLWVWGASKMNMWTAGDPTLEPYWHQWNPAGGQFSHFLSTTIHHCPNVSICLCMNVILKCFSHLCFELGVEGEDVGKKGRRQHRFYLGTHFVEES